MKKSALAPTAATLALLVGSCSWMAPAQSGFYESQHLIQGAIPIQVRSVRLLSAVVDKADYFDIGRSQGLSDDAMRRVEQELRQSIQDDLIQGGPFRTATQGELPYLLDIEFPYLFMPPSVGASYVLRSVNTLLLCVPGLLGMPLRIIKMRGKAVFQLRSPDGRTLVQETQAEIDQSYTVGFYYNGRRPMGHLAALLVSRFKRGAGRRQVPFSAP